MMGGSCCETGGATSLDQVRVAGEVVTRVHLALAGQPNVGKSTIFNLLTGLNQHVGNWPGKTVEQKIGTASYAEATLDIVDLPGTYSLTANSPEELIAREYILTQHPDVIVAIVDAAILERSLYLVAELVQLGMPLVVGLNMLDVAAAHGIRPNAPALAYRLGLSVVPIQANAAVGLEELHRPGDVDVRHAEGHAYGRVREGVAPRSARPGRNVAVARAVDHCAGEQGLAPGLALDKEPLHS
jgi:ferrous iron transport protein B